MNDGTAGQGTCETLSFGTGFRNISAALVVVSSNFWNPWILFMVLGIVIDGIIFMMVFGGAIYRKKRREGIIPKLRGRRREG